jgi:hypothetical protein
VAQFKFFHSSKLRLFREDFRIRSNLDSQATLGSNLPQQLLSRIVAVQASVATKATSGRGRWQPKNYLKNHKSEIRHPESKNPPSPLSLPARSGRNVRAGRLIKTD